MTKVSAAKVWDVVNAVPATKFGGGFDHLAGEYPKSSLVAFKVTKVAQVVKVAVEKCSGAKDWNQGERP